MEIRPLNKYILALASLIFIITWFLLGLIHEPYAFWCEVTYPRRTEINQLVPVTIHYHDIQKEIKLCVDLHWFTKDKSWQGCMYSAKPYTIVERSGAHSFFIKIGKQADLGYVNIIIFLSPTGNWNDRTHAARTDIIIIKKNVRYFRLRTKHPFIIPLYSYSASGKFNGKISKGFVTSLKSSKKPFLSEDIKIWIEFSIYISIALLWFICALRSKTISPLLHNRLRFTLGLFFLIILLFLGIDNLLDLKSSLTELGRNISQVQGWYVHRKPIQRVLISGTVSICSALLLGLTLRMERQSSWFLLAILGILFLIILYGISSLSFHQIDIFLQRSIIGIQISSIFKVIGISCVIISSILCIIKK